MELKLYDARTEWTLPAFLDVEDWGAIESGLQQRARLLNLILKDLYGPRRLIKEGLLPPELIYRLDQFDVDIHFEATDFVQVNGWINERLVAQAIEYLQPATDHRVLDLFCGIGNFTLPLARVSGDVLGIEGEPQQVERARANAARLASAVCTNARATAFNAPRCALTPPAGARWSSGSKRRGSRSPSIASATSTAGAPARTTRSRR